MGAAIVTIGLSVSIAASTGCQRSQSDREYSTSGDDTASGAAEVFEAIDCSEAGPIRRKTDRTIVRGRVLLPVFEGEDSESDAGHRPDQIRDANIGRPRRRERPASDVEVRLDRLETSEQSLVSTRTNASGEWCLSAAEGVELDVELIARAETSRGTLRRSVVTPLRQVISVRSEALTRVLNERSALRAVMSPASYLNLQAVASTAVDLLEPVQWQSVESLDTIAARMRETIEDDRRFQSSVDALTSDDGTASERNGVDEDTVKEADTEGD